MANLLTGPDALGQSGAGATQSHLDRPLRNAQLFCGLSNRIALDIAQRHNSPLCNWKSIQLRSEPFERVHGLNRSFRARRLRGVIFGKLNFRAVAKLIDRKPNGYLPDPTAESGRLAQGIDTFVRAEKGILTYVFAERVIPQQAIRRGVHHRFMSLYRNTRSRQVATLPSPHEHCV